MWTASSRQTREGSVSAVTIYFDASGNAGPVGTVDAWESFGGWLETLDADTNQSVLHLFEQGWEDDLPALAAQLTAALKDSPPDDADAKAVADELLEAIDGKADGDGAVAVTTEGVTA